MDSLTRGMVLNEKVRVMACDTTELVQDAKNRHDLWPTSAAALGRTLSVGSLLGSMLKDEHEKIEIQIKGSGPLGQIVVDGYSDGHVRGYVDNPHVYMKKSKDSHKLDVGGAVGLPGYLRVMRDMGLKEPFTGQVDLQNGEIGQDFAYYFATSEQTPAVVSVGVLVSTDQNIQAAGALIVQLMPGADEETIEAVEKVTTNLPPLSSQLAIDHDPVKVIQSLFPDYQPLVTQHPRFECECSKEKFGDVLATLNQKDLQEMIEQDHGCETVCHFCNAHYRFSEAELKRIVLGSK
jgi:molecular chaperone Hsp33